MNVQSLGLPVDTHRLVAGEITCAVLPQAARLNLRVAPADRAAASAAFGAALPERIGRSVSAGSRAALCLGPDEWVLHTDEADQAALAAAFAAIAGQTPNSLTDISDREIAIEIVGSGAAELLSVGCPRDVAAMPPGTGARTVFDSVQIVLHRDGEDRFRLEVWRSFFPHVWGLLETAGREFASGL